ncbi:MAG: U32 family peptidase [Lachnospiraceae bacterium]|nr:U32 family peptidase [Lachnospiraceae bacterium]
MAAELIKGKMRPEILAPAGTWEALDAAVKAGANAIYVGGSQFSARAYAGNFDQEELLKAIDYCHLFGVKLYMAVNTLLKPEEIFSLASYIEPFYKAGVDGIIVQDTGVIQVLRENYPDLPLHGSTQMSVSSEYGAALLKNMGFTRVVPARELSLSEVKTIKENVNIEIETFVHGAMCYAYSGKCLFSSFKGGRSGNRGRCAQPCRKCYEISTGQKNSEKSRKKTGEASEYIMSLKDMCTLGILPQLIDAGIDSFKIEGRMKNPSYVAATTDAYAKARDYWLKLKTDENTLADNARRMEKYNKFVEPLIKNMMDIYNRGGFYTGYYFTEKGPEMTEPKRPNHAGLRIGKVEKIAPPHVAIQLTETVTASDVLEIRDDKINSTGKDGKTVELTTNVNGASGQTIMLNGKEFKRIRAGQSVYRTRNNQLLAEIEKTILKPEKQLAAECFIEAKKDQPLKIKIVAADGTVAAETFGPVVEGAQKAPTEAEQLRQKMNKTGGTNVKLEPIHLELDDDIFIQMSEFNNLRREALNKFKQAIVDGYKR